MMTTCENNSILQTPQTTHSKCQPQNLLKPYLAHFAAKMVIHGTTLSKMRLVILFVKSY